MTSEQKKLQVKSGNLRDTLTNAAVCNEWFIAYISNSVINFLHGS